MTHSPRSASGLPKAELRAAIRQERRRFVQSLRAQGPEAERRIAEALAAQVIPHLAGACIVAGYRPTPWEIDPGAIEAHLLMSGVTVALPRTHPNAPLTFHAIDQHTVISPGLYGIHEPPANVPVVVPDVILVPLVAVDQRGIRLGQGGGHYDRTLEALRHQRTIRAVGLAFDVQLVDGLDAEPHDQPLDAIATPTRWIEVEG